MPLIRCLLIVILGIGEVLVGGSAWLYGGGALGLLVLGLIFIANYFILSAYYTRHQADLRYQAARKAKRKRFEDLRSKQQTMQP